MNLTLVTISALLTAAESVASTSGRSLHWGKHRGGGKFMLAKLQEKIDSKCNSDFVCPDEVTGCDAIIEWPERPMLDWMDMSEEERLAAKADMKAEVDAFKEQVLTCACCAGKTLEELVGDQGGPGKFMLAKLQQKVESKCNSDFLCPDEVTGCDAVIERPERPMLDWLDMSEEERLAAKADMKAEVEAFKEQVLTCACCAGKSLEELVGDQGGPGKFMLAKLQEKVESKCKSDFVCPDEVTGCDAVIERPERPMLDWLDMSEEEKLAAKADMKAEVEAFKEQVLTCACCAGKTLEELVGPDNDRIRFYDEETSDSSFDGEGWESSSSSEDGGTEDIEDVDLGSLPAQATSIVRASAAVDGLDVQSNPAAGHASISWAIAIAAAAVGIAGWAL